MFAVTESAARHEPRVPHLLVTWPAAVFALLIGVSMVYVPYEFQAASFHGLAPHIRLLGSVFLASSAVLLFTALHPRAPRALDLLGRLLLCTVLGVYWWHASLPMRGLTGIICYPLLAASVLLEFWPAPRERELFRRFLGTVALLFSVLLLGAPEHFSPVTFAHVLPMRWPVGLLFLASSAGLLLPGARGRARRPWAFGLVCLPLAALCYGLGRAGSWTGMELYLVLTLASAGALRGVRLGPPRTVRGKLLRGLAFAGLLPLVVLGGVAVYLAQRTIEREVSADGVEAATNEAALLEGMLGGAREALEVVRDTPGFRESLESFRLDRLSGFLRPLPERVPVFEAAFVVDAQGRGVADCSGTDGIWRADFSQRDYFQGALRAKGDYLSRPFTSVRGRPVVALVSPMWDGPRLQGMLVGLLSLERLTHFATPAARHFRVQVVDLRGLELLRDTEAQAKLLAPAELPPALAEAVSSRDEAVRDTFDAAHRRVLAAPLPVRGSPWVVLVSQEVRTAYRAVTQLSATLIALVALAALAVLGLSQVVARDLIRRLDALNEATTALAEGELRRRVEVGEAGEEDDELDALGRGFNQMARRIEEGQGELERSNEELRDAVRLREEFLSVAGHELRTPLTPLKGFLALTLKRLEAAAAFPEREQTLKALRTMSRQTDRLTRLVGELLDIARLRAGRFDLERAPVELLPMVREVLERFELARDPGLRFELREPEEPVVGLWDEARLEQVLTNLLSNAVRYSPQGGCVRVDFQLGPDSVEVRVRDEGIGIPPESLPGLFQPFIRASNATSRHYGGLGLGLFICREIVERHGGHIWVESAGAQQGSCFHVRLPRLESEAANARPRSVGGA